MESELETASSQAFSASRDGLEFQCRCGALAGRLQHVSGGAGHRVVCYCESCQIFARVLGSVDDVLDANGGTEILQISVAHLEIVRGSEQLACLRITPRGPLRWYTRCCRTPIANSAASAGLPIFGLVLRAAGNGNRGEQLDRLVGPVRFRVQAQDAARDVSGLGARHGFGLPLIWRVVRLYVRARLRGDHAHNPFFDRSSGRPIASARIITAEEREQALAQAPARSRC